MPLLSVHPKELKTGPQRDTCTSMCTAAVFTIAQEVEQSNVNVRGVDKHSVIFTYNVLLFSLKREGDPVTHYSIAEL